MFAILLLIPFLVSQVEGQEKEAFLKLYEKYESSSGFDGPKEDTAGYEESLKAMKLLRDLYSKETALNGKGAFSFSGNESSGSDLYKFGAEISLSKGMYPVQLEYSSKVSMQAKDVELQERLSDLAVSFDFHPCSPANDDPVVNTDGLWLENFVFMKRFSDEFMNIKQKYEVGFGATVNCYSSTFTKNGDDNNDLLSNDELFKGIGHRPLSMTEAESRVLQKARETLLRANTKRYSTYRLALLLGLFFEIEEADASGALRFNDVDTVLTVSRPTTHVPRWELRPTLEWRPFDRYLLEIDAYFKLPVPWEWEDVVETGGASDKRGDVFIDFQSTFSIQMEDGLIVSLQYRYLYDHAPPRVFRTDDNGMPVLLLGQVRHHQFGLSIGFTF